MFTLSISEDILLFISGLGLLKGVLLAGLIFFHPKSDRTMVTFGVPIPLQNHSQKAVNAAVEVLKQLESAVRQAL